MPEWLFGGLVTFSVSLIGTAGLVVGYVISSKTARATSTQQAAATASAAERSDAQQMIDQLQEELGRHRAAQDARATAQDERMTKLEDRNHDLVAQRDGYRDHAHELRSHIWDGKPPPPPEWPQGLPR